MKCKELLALLGGYVDGSLPREEYEAFRQHLSGCGPCEVVVDNIRRTISLYKSGHRVELPETLQNRLRSVLRDRWQAKFSSAES